METERMQPWPEQEDIKTFQTPFDVLDEELRLYPTSADTQASLDGLNKWYGGTNFADSLKFYAGAATESIAMQSQLEPDDIYQTIYRGGLLGLRIGTYCQRPHLKPAIFGEEFDDSPSPTQYPSESPEAYYARYTETYLDDVNDNISKLESLSDDEQFALMLSAERACAYIGSDYEPYFIAGVLKSLSQIRLSVDGYYGQNARR